MSGDVIIGPWGRSATPRYEKEVWEPAVDLVQTVGRLSNASGEAREVMMYALFRDIATEFKLMGVHPTQIAGWLEAVVREFRDPETVREFENPEI